MAYLSQSTRTMSSRGSILVVAWMLAGAVVVGFNVKQYVTMRAPSTTSLRKQSVVQRRARESTSDLSMENNQPGSFVVQGGTASASVQLGSTAAPRSREANIATTLQGALVGGVAMLSLYLACTTTVGMLQKSAPVPLLARSDAPTIAFRSFDMPQNIQPLVVSPVPFGSPSIMPQVVEPIAAETPKPKVVVPKIAAPALRVVASKGAAPQVVATRVIAPRVIAPAAVAPAAAVQASVTPKLLAPAVVAPPAIVQAVVAPEALTAEVVAPEVAAPVVSAPAAAAPAAVAPGVLAPHAVAQQAAAPLAIATPVVAPATAAPEVAAPPVAAVQADADSVDENVSSQFAVRSLPASSQMRSFYGYSKASSMYSRHK